MYYHNITKDDMLNGDGLRVVLWVAGCEHHCKGCHNPVTWEVNGGLPFDQAAEQEIYDELEHSYISGITLSGGDPLHPENRDEIGRLIGRIKSRYPDKTVWLYTGYEWDQIKNLPFIKDVDVIVDGKFVQKLFDAKLKWRGSANQRVIDVQESLRLGKVVLQP